MADSIQFTVAYDGDALESHEMDVRELAPSLLAMSDLFQEANQIINRGHAQVSVKVKGTFKTGSFPVDIVVHQSILDLLNFLNTPAVVGALNLASLLGIGKLGFNGVLRVLLWLKNRPIENVIKVDNETIRLEVKQESLEVNMDVFRLLTNIRVRRSIEKIVSPLKTEGVTRLSVKDQYNEILTINTIDVEYFDAPEIEEQQIEDSHSVTNLQLVNVAFQESNKWRFTDGTTSFFALVSDKDFIDRVQNNTESFAKNDILKVQLRKIQYEIETGIKTEYEVLKVLNHKRVGQQLNLPLDGSFNS